MMLMCYEVKMFECLGFADCQIKSSIYFITLLHPKTVSQ